MTNFIFKSSRGLIKNSPIPDGVLGQLKIIQGQNRAIRQDILDVRRLLNKLLIDKHLQYQVDDWFNRDQTKDDASEDEQ